MSGYPSLVSRRAFAIVAVFLVFAAFFPMAPAFAAGYSLSIDDVAVAEGNAGTTTATFTVTLTPPAGANPITVTATSASLPGDTATAGLDYVAGSQLLTFNTGVSTQTFSVTVNGDTIDEGAAETYSVSLSGASVGGGDTVIIGDGLGAGSILDDDPLPVISADTPSAFEVSGSIDFLVSMDRASSSVVTVAYATTNGTAVAPGDYNAASGTLTFNPGVTSQTVTVLINDDAVDEANETLLLLLAAPVNATTGPNGIGTILDDDLVAASIDDPSVSEAGGSLTFTVTLDEPPAVVTTVDYTTSDGTANQPGDYTLTFGTLTFVVGDAFETITVPVINDGIDEPNETVIVTLSNPSANAYISDATGTGTITDDEATPTVTVDSPSAGEAAGNMNFTVSLSGPSAYTLTVDWATANSNASTPEDYLGGSGTVTFVPGDVTETVSIPIVDDNIDEVDENFWLVLSNPSANLTLGAPSSNFATIVDNDAAPTISINDVSGPEAGGSLTFTVSLSNPSSFTVTVDYATSAGTATSGIDYAALGLTTLTFAPMETSKTITVTLLDDTTDEPNETFFVDLSSPVNGGFGDNQGQGTINDDDNAPVISVSSPSAWESAGLIGFVLTLSNPSSSVVTVDCWTSDGTAVQPADYGLTGAAPCATFPAGSVGPITIWVGIVDDAIVEGNETFNLDLSNPTNATIGATPGVGTILDNDPTLDIDLTASKAENATPLDIDVNLNVAVPYPVTVYVTTSDGTATAGLDYVAYADTLVFAPFVTEETISITILDDNIDEPNETFNVNLSSPTGPAFIGNGTGVATIIDDEATPTVSINSPSAAEASGAMTFTLTLSGPSAYTLTLDLATAGITATDGLDYTSTTYFNFTFLPGETSRTTDVSLTDDSTYEGNETFTYTISNLSANLAPGTLVGTATILDDDPVPTVNIDSPSVDEGAGTMKFTASLTNPSAFPIFMCVLETPGTATPAPLPGADYIPTPILPSAILCPLGTLDLIFLPGATTQTFTLPILEDAVDELDETIIESIIGPAPIPSGPFIPGIFTGIGTIQDNDVPVVAINDPAAIGEAGGPLGFTITLDRCPATDVTVNGSTTDGSAVDTEDYGGVAFSVTWFAAGCVTPPGPVSMTINIGITDDAIYEPGGNEDFTVNLTSVTPSAIIDPLNGSGYGQIIDNETAPTVNLSSPTVVENAGTMTFTATLTGAADVPLSVDWYTSQFTALFGFDYVAANGTVNFAAYDTSETFNVTILDDNVWEPTETFNLVMANPLPVADLILGANGVGTITDDDPVPTLSIEDVGAFEGNAGVTAFNFTVNASNPSSLPMGVLLTTADGTAISLPPGPVGWGDYTAGVGGLLIPPGATSGNFTVWVNGDVIVESTEVFTVTMSAPSNAVLDPTDFVGYGTIANDDTTYVSITDVTELEGDIGTRNAIFTITMTNQVDIPMLVDYTVAAGGPIPATAGVDYNSLIFGTLTFLPGVTSLQVIVPIYGDLIDEENETFLMQLSPNVLNPGLLFSDNEGLGTITDDDPDVTPPVLNLPASPLIVEATGPLGAIVGAAQGYVVSASDAPHPDVPINCTPPAGSLFPLGDTIVGCSATDLSSNTTTGSFTIRVVDTTPPVVTVPANITVEATGPSGAVVNFVASATDVVGVATFACVPPSGSTFPIATTTVTCTATDAAGNVGTGTFTIKVQDTTPPVVTVPANMTVEATGPSGAVVNFVASATDVVGVATFACVPPSGSTFPIATTTVTCTATDAAGNVGTGTFTIKVQDTTPPVLTLPGNMTVEATGPGGAIVSWTATATDIVGVVEFYCTPASSSLFPLGATKVDCQAKDAAGNMKTGNFYVTVVDTTPPVITLLGSSPITVPLNSTYIDAGATAADLVDGDLTGSIVTVSNVDTTIIGTYTVTYDVTDAHGNAAVQVTRTVNVAHFCGGLEATIVGTPAGETLTGTAGDDVIVALDGADTIYGLGGNDLVCAGGGDDAIYGGDGNDTIYGNAGGDYMAGEGGDDVLYGGIGNDIFVGGAGNDYMVGGTGIDVADYSAAGAVTIDLLAQVGSGDGADTLIGFENLIGSAFDDLLIGNSLNNKIRGGSGNDTINGGGGHDTLYGLAGDDILRGGGGDDTLWGGTGNDTLNGGAGIDVLDGNGGTNTCTLGEVLNNC